MRKSPRRCDRPESSPLFAKFIKRSDDVVFRLDTRIYFSDDAAPGNDDKCIAAIVAKNTGSAQPRTYGALSAFDRGKGQLLTFVWNRFKDAFERAGKRIPKGCIRKSLESVLSSRTCFPRCDQDIQIAQKAVVVRDRRHESTNRLVCMGTPASRSRGPEGALSSQADRPPIFLRQEQEDRLCRPSSR
jgi:hypothetical protein